MVVVGVDGVVCQNCSISILPLLLDFASLELILVFAIFSLVGLFSRLCGQVAS